MVDDKRPPSFDAVWSTLGLDRLSIAHDATITALTLAANDVGSAATVAAAAASAGPVDDLARSLKSLPEMSLRLPAPGEPVVQVHGPDDSTGHDIELLGLLGEGGMGRVYRARQRSLVRDVAVKTLKPEATAAATIASLITEAVMTGHLEHPNIVPVHALGRDARDRPVLLMKRIDGVAWRDLLHDEAHPAWQRLAGLGADRLEAHLGILTQVCHAVHYAHSHSIVHRDIKPENVMIGEFGEVYLVDWGVAMRLQDGSGPPAQLVGTPLYMAPEMVDPARGPIGPRTDVYLLGATLHEVLTGRTRHDGDTLRDVLEQAHRSRPCAHGEHVPAELAELCTQATSLDPALRPETPLAFRQRLADFLRHKGSIALTDVARQRLAEAREEGEPGDPASERRRRYRLLGECRFGFEQALREWSENAAAKAGLQSCLEAHIEVEIADENPVTARAILAELPTPRPELAASIDALEEALRLRRERGHELEKMAHALDLGVGARSRTLLFLGVAIATSLLAVWGSYAIRRFGFDYKQSLIAPAGLFTVTLLGAIVGRRHLVNAINRRMIGLVLVTAAAMFLHRLAFMHVGAPVIAVFVCDLLLTGLAAAAAAIAFVPSLGWIAAILFLSTLVTAAWSDRAPEILSATVISCAVVLAIVQRGWGKR